MKEAYAKALYEALRHRHQTDMDDVLSSFYGVLKDRGHMRLLPGIAKAFGVIAKSESEKPTLVVARDGDVQKVQQHLRRFEDSFDLSTGARVEIDETIVGGFVLKSKEKRVDASYKEALQGIYRAAIK